MYMCIKLILIGVQDKKENVEKPVITEETAKENSLQPKVFDIKEWNSEIFVMYMYMYVYKDVRVCIYYIIKHVHVHACI